MKLLKSCIKSQEDAKLRGYLGELAWLEKMSKRYVQKKCDRCGLFHIWKMRPKFARGGIVKGNTLALVGDKDLVFPAKPFSCVIKKEDPK